MDQVLLSSADISSDGKLKQSVVLFSSSAPSSEALIKQEYALNDAKALDDLRSQIKEISGVR